MFALQLLEHLGRNRRGSNPHQETQFFLCPWHLNGLSLALKILFLFVMIVYRKDGLNVQSL